MRKLGVIGAACAALAIAAPAREARASDDGAIIVTVIVVGLAVVGTDVAFTAYDVGRVVDHKEVDTSWMVAHAILMPPQAILGHVPTILGELEKDDKDAKVYAPIFLPITMWANALATFSIWSIADKSVDVRPRFGVSWLVGSDVTLATGLAASLWSERHYAKPWLSIPAILVGGAELGGTAYAATQDPTHRGEWIALAAWSGTMATHGLVSLIAWAADPHRRSVHAGDTTDYPTPFEPPELPPPAPRHRAPAPRPPLEVPAVAPTPITNGASIVPGVSILGRF